MDFRLINYTGIDDIEEYCDFDICMPYILDGKIKCDFEIENLLSFGFNKECVDYKAIDFFDKNNNEDEKFYDNLIIINNKFELDFEYSSKDTSSLLNVYNHKIYVAAKTSIEDYERSDLKIELFTKDLFCNLVDSNEIYYCANLIIGISIL